jgi:hypothetical protein
MRTVVYQQRLAFQAKVEEISRNEVNPMTVRQRRYSKEELAQRGQALYDSSIRQQVEAGNEGNEGKIIAIDIETGDFEISEDTLIASDRLLERNPDAQTWFIRIGHRGVHRFGWHELTAKK